MTGLIPKKTLQLLSLGFIFRELRSDNNFDSIILSDPHLAALDNDSGTNLKRLQNNYRLMPWSQTLKINGINLRNPFLKSLTPS